MIINTRVQVTLVKTDAPGRNVLYGKFYCFWLNMLVLLTVGLLRIFPAHAEAPRDLVSRPAGFMCRLVPAGGYAHVAIPFIPFTSDLNVILAGQLTGSTNMACADVIQHWLVLPNGVWRQNIYKYDGSGDPMRDGRWFEDSNSLTPTSITLENNDGFWIFNTQDFKQTVLFSGEVPLADQAVTLFPENFNGYALSLGYPFAAAQMLSDVRLDPPDFNGNVLFGFDDSLQGADLFARMFNGSAWQWHDGFGVTNPIIPIGQGFWLSDWGNTALVLTNNRPYDAPFPIAAQHQPRIVDIRKSSLPDGVDLSLTGTGTTGEVLDVFWQDTALTNGFKALNWTLAASVQLAHAGTNFWTDIGADARPAPGKVPLRFYLLGRTDIDSDADGLPNAREHYVHHTDPESPDSDADGLPDGWEINHAFDPLSAADALQDADNDGLSNLQEYQFGTNPLKTDSDDDGLTDTAELGAYRLMIVPTSWVDLQADATSLREVLLYCDDDGAATVTLPFAFPMQSNLYTTAQIGVNGLIEFAAKLGGYSPYYNETLPYTETGPIIAAFWDDLCLFPIAADILYAHVPLRTSTAFVVEWREVAHLYDSGNTRLTFQVVLEPSGIVRVNYRTLIGEYTDGALATLGVQGKDSYSATLFAYNQTGVVFDGLSIVYEPVAPSNPLNPDSDGDALDDAAENEAGTNPLNPDSDGDGLPDGWEIQQETNPLDPDDAGDDWDGDGLSTHDEWAYGTDLRLSDTDGDGLDDNAEIVTFHTDPLMADSDHDGLHDGEEILTYGTNPLMADTDGDGLSDGAEVLPLGRDVLPGASGFGYRMTSGASSGAELGEHAVEVSAWQGENANSSDVIKIDGFAVIPTGFDFPCGYLTWNSVYVGLHGVIGLSAPATEYRNEELPSVRLPPTTLMPFWDDIVMSAEGHVRYATINTPGDRHLVIEWRDFTRHDTPTTRLSFQALLYENGIIEYRYLRTEGPAADGNSATIGLQVGTPECFSCFHDSAIGTISAGRFVRFNPGRYVNFNPLQGTSPLNADSDNDGLPDGWEIAHGLNPLCADGWSDWNDSDTDGLYDIDEYYYGTDPLSADTDNDGLQDVVEIFLLHSDPNVADPALANADADGDGLSNAAECAYGLDIYNDEGNWIRCHPCRPDSDGDELSDGDEVYIYGTSPVRYDTDQDGLRDNWEIAYGRDPLDPADGQYDTDGDGLSDGAEISYWGSSPFVTDSDGDGITDGVEADNDPQLHPMRNDLIADADGDGAGNIAEYLAGTRFDYWDTDGDAAADGLEIAHGLNPLDPRDGLRDTDGDRVPDTFELAWGSNPHDARSIPQTPFVAHTAAALSQTIAAALAAPSNHCALVRLLPDVIYSTTVIPKASAALCIFAPAGSTATIIRKEMYCLNFQTTYPIVFAGIIFNANGGRTGVWGESSAPSIFRDCVFTGGKIFESGFVQGWNYAHVSFENSVFSGNTCEEHPGQWSMLVMAWDVRFDYCTFVANTNMYPGGGRNGHGEVTTLNPAAVTCHNSLFWDNPGIKVANMTFDAATTIDVDPHFEPGAWRLAWDSPCIGRSTNTSIPFDAEGHARRVPSNIGAFERVGQDFDDDGLPDAWELDYGLPTNAPSADLDPDGDGLSTLIEYYLHTNPLVVDTDGDGLSDDVEVNQTHTCPTSTDTDNDGLPDSWEVACGTNPLVRDENDDPDGDGLPNWMECQFGTHPNQSDSDGDDLNDGWELAHGFNPLTADTTNHTDPDGDGLDTVAESLAGTDDFCADSDGDGLSDGLEVAAGTNPLLADTDGDGLNDYVELTGTGAYLISLSPVSEWVTFSESSHWITEWLTPAFKDDNDGKMWIDNAYAAPLPCDIRVGTNSARTVHISANGLMALDTRFSNDLSPSNAPPVNISLPIADAPSLIAAYWDDLIVPATNGVWWATNMLDGVQRLVVTWESALGAHRPSYAIRLQVEYRADTHIFTFRYLSKEGSLFLNDIAAATIGIQGAAGIPVGQLNYNRIRAIQPGTMLTFRPIHTNPLNHDTDGDGIADNVEIQIGSDPNLADATNVDYDGDGLNLVEEVANNTNPWDQDTDGDGFSDAEEIAYTTDPCVPCDPNDDLDGDGLSNWEEYCHRTHPYNWDTDYDGISDFIEASQGSDPTDSGDGGLKPPIEEVADVGIDFVYEEELQSGPVGAQVELGRIRHRPHPYSNHNAIYRLQRGVSLPVNLAVIRPANIYQGGVCLSVDGQLFEWRAGALFTSGSVLLLDPEHAFVSWSLRDIRNPPLTARLTLPRVRIVSADGTPLTASICGQTTMLLNAEVLPICSGSYAWSAIPADSLQNPGDNQQTTVIVPEADVMVTVVFTPANCLGSVTNTVTIKAHHQYCLVNLGLPPTISLNNDNDCSLIMPDFRWPELSDTENDVPKCGPYSSYCCTRYARQCFVSITRDPGGPPVKLYHCDTLPKTPFSLPDNTPADQIQNFRIEGIQNSAAINDVRYTMTLKKPSAADEVTHVATTVLRVDLDADLNDDARIDPADPDDPAEAQSPGLVIDLQAGRMSCLRVQACLPTMPSDAKLRLAAYGAPIRLWDGENQQTATCVIDTSDAATDNDFLQWNASQFAELGGQNTDATVGKTYWVEGLQKGESEFKLSYEGGDILSSDNVIASIISIAMTPDFNRDGRIDETDTESMAIKELFRFWINDDRDIGDDATSAQDDSPLESYQSLLSAAVMNRLPNGQDNNVNGTRDLIDFFPVKLDLPLDLFSPYAFTYTIKQQDAAINLVYTALTADDVRAIHTRRMISGFGPTGESGAADAPSKPVPASGIGLPTAWLAAGHNVILIEGHARSTNPLILEIAQNGRVICRRTMGMSVSPVRDMIRYLNVRTCNSYFTQHTSRPTTQGKWLTRLSPPPNYPDGFYNLPDEPLKTFVTVHGLDWDENESPAGNAELFKRFFQSGMNARFIGVSWASDLSRRFGGPIVYANDVLGAFITAPYIKRFLADFAGPDMSVFAHSLGNMLVSSAIQDHNMLIGKYFMVNAAVPLEAYDGRYASSTERMKMVPPSWKPPVIAISERLMCAQWSELFAIYDPRSALTWANRFKDVVTRPSLQVYQFYSTGEEILREPDGTLPNFADTTDVAEFFWPAVGSDTLAGARERVWVYHEMTKGRFPETLIPRHNDAGWGWNLYYTSANWPTYLSREELIARPVFKRFSVTQDANIPGWFDLSDWLYCPSCQNCSRAINNKLPLDSFVGQSMLKIKNHAKIMAECMPPMSGPAGSFPSEQIARTPNRSFNLNISPYKDGNLWPTDRPTKSEDQERSRRWLHGDYKDVAYLYVHQLYETITENIR